MSEPQDQDFSKGPPNPYAIYREIGVITSKLDSVLDNQKDFKDHMVKKFEIQDDKNKEHEERFDSLEGSRGVLVGIVIFVSTVATLLVDFFKGKHP